MQLSTTRRIHPIPFQPSVHAPHERSSVLLGCTRASSWSPTSGRRPGFTRRHGHRADPLRLRLGRPGPAHSQSERSGGRCRRRWRQASASEAYRRGEGRPSLPPLRIPPRQPRGFQRFGGRRPVVPRGRETQPAPVGGPAGEQAAAAAAALEWVTAQQGCRPSRLLPSEWRLPNRLPSESAPAIQAGDRLIRTCRHSSASAASASEPLRLHLSRGLTRIRD